MHMVFISPTFKRKKCFMIRCFPRKTFGVFFVNGNVFCSQHILTKAKTHTQVLFCCLKCPLATTSLVFITVMQNIVTEKFYILRRNELLN